MQKKAVMILFLLFCYTLTRPGTSFAHPHIFVENEATLFFGANRLLGIGLT